MQRLVNIREHYNATVHYQAYHINYLQLKAIHLTINTNRNLWKGCKHIKIRSDNTTTIASVNNMGGLVSRKVGKINKNIFF